MKKSILLSALLGAALLFAVCETEPKQEAPAFGISLSRTDTLAFEAAVEGYGTQPAETITIDNIGSEPTGSLTFAVSETDSGLPSEAFTLSRYAVTSIAPGGRASFTVRPSPGLAEGVYNAVVTVNGGGGINAGFGASFTVTEAEDDYVPVIDDSVYAIELEADGGNTFPDATFGYGTQAAKTLRVRNTGNRDTGSLSLIASNADFTLSRNAMETIPPDEEAVFTVAPSAGLAAGTHTATITAIMVASSADSGSADSVISAKAVVSFTVTAPSYGIALDTGGVYVFPRAAENYKAPGAKAFGIRNTGDQPTGSLTAALTGDNPEAFTLGAPSAIASIPAGASGSVTVEPAGGLGAGTYTADVLITGANGISASVGVSFRVFSMQTFAGLVGRMSEETNLASASYTLPGGAETYATALTLTVANSPKNVVIDGDGRAVAGSANGITVGPGITLTLRNIAFKALPLVVQVGAKLVLDEGAEVSGCAGTGVTVNGGTLEMRDGSLVTDNRASGIVLEDTGRFTMNGGLISNNIAIGVTKEGGGVLVKGSSGVFNMNGGSIRDNEALLPEEGCGGGVAVTGGGIFAMADGSISGNDAGRGGGVYMKGDGARFTVTGGSISGNDAARGGGVCMEQGEGLMFILDGGAITGNKASESVGGVCFYGENAVFTMNGGEISGNTSEGRAGGIEFLGAGLVFNMTGGAVKGNSAVVQGGGVHLSPSITVTGDPWIGSGAKMSGSGPGWIYGNKPEDMHYYD